MEVGGEGEGWHRWLVGAQNPVPSVAHPKLQSLAAIGFHGTLFLSKTIFSFEIIDRLLTCQLGGQC